MVESKADVAASRCFSPPPSHHLSLTIRLAAGATLHSNGPSTGTKPTLLHTCAESALLNDAPTHRSTCAAAQCSNSCFLEVWLQQVTCKCFDFVCVSLPCTVILNAIPHFRTVSGTPSFFLNGVSIDADPACTSADWQQVLRVRVGSRVMPYTSLAVIRL